MNTYSDCEDDDKISFNFIVNWKIYDLAGGLHTPMLITAD